ncbi:hypothetical protein H8A97_03495 [Bradyrhizobium sp. Arg62]|uniref:hypothetical protein n=1 Tax=Bradyrhizobium brasilense TaxID=1419277 RepID=UPI001E5A7428|nr:hypothetical protein [Bradyrhizobium brasilense]MCC8944187.1 hypothetical protein [Bradyrhizobium brasilense]
MFSQARLTCNGFARLGPLYSPPSRLFLDCYLTSRTSPLSSKRGYARELAERHDIHLEFIEIPDDVISEFKAFGLSKIGDLKLIADDETLREVRSFIERESLIGFVRTLMMYHDIDRYFAVWKPWSSLDNPTALLLEKKFGRKKVNDLLSEHEIEIIQEEE